MPSNRNYANVVATTFVSDSGTTIQIASNAGLPAVPFIMDAEWGTANAEVMLINNAFTFVSANVYQSTGVTRGYDGTTLVTHSAGAAVSHGVSAVDFAEAGLHLQATGQTTDPTTGTTVSVHGIASSSAVVGVNETQTLKNKTLDISNIYQLTGFSASNQTLSSTSAANITGLSVAVPASGTYLLEAWVPAEATGTIGGATTYAFTFGGTLTSVNFNWQLMNSGTGNAITGTGGQITTITTSMTSATRTGSSGQINNFEGRGILVASGAGTLQLTGLVTIAADTTLVLAGSYLRLTRLA